MSNLKRFASKYYNLIKFPISKFNLNYTYILEKEIQDCESILDLGCGMNSALGKINTNNKYTVGVDIFKECSDRKLTKEEEKIVKDFLDIYRVKRYKRLTPHEKKTRIWNFVKFKNLLNIFKIVKKDKPRIEVNILKLINIGLKVRIRIFILKLFKNFIFDKFNNENK